jgi:hypothetical protein
VADRRLGTVGDDEVVCGDRVVGEDLADGRSETTAADIAQLSFELRVMQARLGAGAAPSNTL